MDFTVNTRHSKMAFAVRKKDEADRAKKDQLTNQKKCGKLRNA